MRPKKSQLTNETRSRIISKYEKGKPVTLIAQELELAYQSVNSVIKVYKNTGRIQADRSNYGRKKTINDAGINLIKEVINEDVSITLRNIKEVLFNKLNICASVSTIDRTISAFNYSFKRLQLIPEARNTTKTIEKRFEYANFYSAQNEDRIIFLDEFGCSCSIRSNYGRSAIGTTPRKNIRTIRSKNYSVSAAISKRKLLHFKTISLPYNGERYAEFIVDFLVVLERENMSHCIFIMDNCSMHKVAPVREIIEEGGHSLVFLPPYSPQLSPIEECFSQWKSKIKSRNPNSTVELENAIQIAFDSVSTTNCVAYFDHVREFAVKALKMEQF